MKAGKISETVLKRSVLKITNQQGKKHMVSKAAAGCDAGLYSCEETANAVATSCTALSGCEEGLATVAVNRVCNSLAAAGGNPTAVTIQLVLPETAQESELKEIMREVISACEATDTVLANGHTQISRFVTEPVISATASGNISLAVIQEETVYGSELVMTKSAGLAGAALLAKYYRENLHDRYTYTFIDKAVSGAEEVSVLRETAILKSLGIRHMHDVAEGGVFGAVWEMCERLSAGVELDLKKIPIRQETVEVCEFFDVNPYQLKGDGALLFLTTDSETAIRALKEAGVFATVIGRMKESNGRILINGEETRFLEPNRVDEYETARKFERK